MQQSRIAFIGAGNMASSLIGGLINNGYNPQYIFASNPEPEKLQQLAAKFAIQTSSSNQEAAKNAEIIVFCVKPNKLKAVVKETAAIINTHQPLLISIVAGIRLASILKWLGKENPLVRCMPNTPALVGSGATALYANNLVTSSQKILTESLLRGVGITVWLDHEEELDLVTALSGSGPAYFFLMMEALSEAATQKGLAPETAKLLTIQTALGAARMALESNQALDELRQQVTSPGGTTEAALRTLLQGQFKKLLAEALNSAQNRSLEIAHLFDTQDKD